MPELPEVETVSRLLTPVIAGRTIVNVRVSYWRMIKSGHETFISALVGQTFTHVGRHGKFLIFFFESDLILISHLRMEGKYIELTDAEPDSRYARVVVEFASGGKLCYDDSRCFGTMQISSRATYLKEPPLTSIGPEPFHITDVASIHATLTRSARPIKELLLNQTIMTGLGNIYADEVLFLAKIHPELPGTYLTKDDTTRLISHSKDVLSAAIASGGSTIRTYHAAKGVDGKFQHALQAYDRAGQPCFRCQTLLVKIKVTGRGSTFCPRCQVNRALPYAVGITGHMHAGKSTLLATAAEAGYPTLSADAIVKELYQDTSIVEKAATLLKITFPDDRFDAHLIAEAILKDPKAKIRLEKFIHPLVKARVIAWIKSQNTQAVFIEVPLLYQAHWEHLFPYVIGVKVPYLVQKARIEKNFPNPDLALALAQTNDFAIYEKNVADLLVNDVDYDTFRAEAKAAVVRAIASI